MAAAFRHHVLKATNTTTTAIHAAVPAGKALAVSKIVVSHYANGAAATFWLGVGTATTDNNWIALGVPLSVGQQWTETGIVVPAGEFVYFYAATANLLVAHVFGKEVDV